MRPNCKDLKPFRGDNDLSRDYDILRGITITKNGVPPSKIIYNRFTTGLLPNYLKLKECDN